MSRTARHAPGSYVYHVLNRGVARLRLFEKEGDYQAFERVLAEARHEKPVRLLGYCLMPNHWHMVLWPEHDGDLTAFVGWLTHTHSMRWHAHYHSGGTGHIYQGRFKSFPVETEDYLYAVLRYVERNALRANIVSRAEQWRWGSLWRRQGGAALPLIELDPWPVPMPANWLELVNAPQTEAEMKALRQAVARNSPFGSPAWCQRTAKQLGLQHTLRPQGRPRKQQQEERPEDDNTVLF